ncbi:hypothetical protein MMALV_06920 [Candidatus Methanomethylophilus alvi Mx1201]|uniref:Uncharacterized protein n=1 Tax=Methanomethylophilus alvi (strain Mx1201) TaxID=1236689 RepID=M9SAU6_METAX|nr:hypothetical protein MMALV_06920 [Candidatus Methanomethylophilus alvi Mx1201]
MFSCTRDLITLSSLVTSIASNLCSFASCMRSCQPGRLESFAEASSEYSRKTSNPLFLAISLKRGSWLVSSCFLVETRT